MKPVCTNDYRKKFELPFLYETNGMETFEPRQLNPTGGTKSTTKSAPAPVA